MAHETQVEYLDAQVSIFLVETIPLFLEVVLSLFHCGCVLSIFVIWVNINGMNQKILGCLLVIKWWVLSLKVFSPSLRPI